MRSHRSEKLDQLIGKKVKITFKDGTTVRGKLDYVDSFGRVHDYRRPGFYYVGDITFRKTHVQSAISIL